MVQITSLFAVKPSKTFGQIVNGELNRIVRAVWRTNDGDEDDLVMVGERDNYMGNFFLPQKYDLSQNGIDQYTAVLRSKLADGSLKMNGFTFTVAELTGNVHKGFRNLATGRVSRKVDRAFKEGTSEKQVFTLVKDDLERAATKSNKTIEWVDE